MSDQKDDSFSIAGHRRHRAVGEHATVAILIGCGLRRGELLSLKLES